MHSPREVGVIVVAAGRGVRAGGGEPKQFRDVAGVPMLLRAIRPFTTHPRVAHVVTVLPAAQAGSPPEWLAALVGPVLTLTAGGTTRAESVRAGLRALPPECTLVLVHDGARPFPPRQAIDGVIAAAAAGRGALTAVPLADTLKAADDGAPPAATRTITRDGLWCAQTPQGFPRAMLERAHAAGAGAPTDDAQLVEEMGMPVLLVPGSNRNLKVTTEDDLRLAAAIAHLGDGA